MFYARHISNAHSHIWHISPTRSRSLSLALFWSVWPRICLAFYEQNAQNVYRKRHEKGEREKNGVFHKSLALFVGGLLLCLLRLRLLLRAWESVKSLAFEILCSVLAHFDTVYTYIAVLFFVILLNEMS